MSRPYRTSLRRRKEQRQEAEDNLRFYQGRCSHGTPAIDECEECKEEQLADEVKDDPYFKEMDEQLLLWKDGQHETQ